MVRLKDTWSVITVVKIITFQFLMVRLKVNKVFKVFKVKTLISIPYGAIKRFCFNFRDFLSERFQFLMVRLKAILHILYF